MPQFSKLKGRWGPKSQSVFRDKQKKKKTPGENQCTAGSMMPGYLGGLAAELHWVKMPLKLAHTYGDPVLRNTVKGALGTARKTQA